MKALVLEKVGELSLRDVDLSTSPGVGEVLIDIDTVGICGSDVHYYQHGRIGPFVVNDPMVLGHEASGVVSKLGDGVTHLKVGDRVCMEPGIPDPTSRASKLGVYNVDPSVRFWATPPIHGCLAPQVVHPASFTYRMPNAVSFAEGAMVEPFAIGLQAATRARIQPGDVALVTGAGPIGIMCAIALLSGGCSTVIISDPVDKKLKIAGSYKNILTVNPVTENLPEMIETFTSGWGVDILVEASGNPRAFEGLFDLVRPAGAVVLVGMPIDPVPMDIVAAQAREVRIETVFRYANVYDRALKLIASKSVDLNPLISETFTFAQSIEAFERAAEARPTDVKLQIKVNS